MKQIFAIILTLALLTPCMAMRAEARRLEGDGFDSPEEAVTAYLDAMNRSDVGEMLSTFALETFAEHVNPELYIRRLRAFSPTSYYGVLVTDEYSLSLMAHNRYGILAGALMRQYMETGASLNGMVVSLNTAEEVKEIVQKFAQSPMCGIAGHVEFLGWVNPAVLTQEKIIYPANRVNMALQRAYAGADDLAEMAAHVRVNGVDGLLLMACAKYDGKWYNLEFGGYTGAMMGLDMAGQVMKLVLTLEDMQLSMAMLLNSYPEASAAWDAGYQSELAGTRWILTELNVPGMTVSAAAESLGDDGVWAEMRMYRIGSALITVRVGETVQTMLNMPWEDAYLGLAWHEENGDVQADLLKALNKEIQLDFASCTASRPEENRIVFRFGDGTEAVFEKQ